MSRKYFQSLQAVIALVVCTLSIHPLLAEDIKTGDPATVATFNGSAITEADLEKAAARDLEQLELQRIQMNTNYLRTKHQILETVLANLLEEKVFEAEAAKRGVSKEAFLAKDLEGKVNEPSSQDINNFYEANKQKIGQPLAQVSGQIQQYLKAEKYNNARRELAARLKAGYGITIALQPIRSNVETAGSPSLGPADAPVTLVEFSDFQCPYCSRYSTTLNDLLAKYGKEVRLVYRQFPLSQIHPFAEKAAEASLCAADQGHFWEMHDLMFQGQAQLSEADLRAKAARLQINMDTFSQCLLSDKYAAKVRQDQQEGQRLGITGTPALFINGRFLSGALSLDDLARIIDEELHSKNASAPQAGKIAAQNGGHFLPAAKAAMK